MESAIWQIGKEVDVDGLERKIHELFFELGEKRKSVEEVRKQLSIEILSKHELEFEVKQLKDKESQMQLQLDAVSSALQKHEEHLSSGRNESLQQKQQQLDITTNTLETVKEQLLKEQMGNLELKSKVEELERRVRSDAIFRETSSKTQEKINAALETFSVQKNNLEKDMRSMTRLANTAVEMANKHKILIDHRDEMLKQIQLEKEESEKRNRELSVEIEKLKADLKTLESSSEKENNNYVVDVLQEWQACQNDMKRRITTHNEEYTLLQQTLQKSVDCQTRLQALEVAASQRNKELEETLKMEREMNQKPPKQDIAVQTNRKTQTSVSSNTVQIAMYDKDVQSECMQFNNVSVETQTPDEWKKLKFFQLSEKKQDEIIKQGADVSQPPTATNLDCPEQSQTYANSDFGLQKKKKSSTDGHRDFLPAAFQENRFFAAPYVEHLSQLDINDIGDVATQKLNF